MNLSSFTPEQLAELKNLLLTEQRDQSGRSPFTPRQRHDLTVRPGIKDEFGRYIPTPLFISSTDGVAVPFEPPPFGQLLWSPPNRDGKQIEVCARSPKEVDDYIALGYETKPIPGHAPDAMELIQAQFEALSEEDQKLMLEMQAQDKKARLRELMASLSERDLEQLVGQAKKRGPGRPKKMTA